MRRKKSSSTWPSTKSRASGTIPGWKKSQEYELEEAKVTGFTGQEIALILAKNDDVEDPAAWHDDEEDEEDEDPDFLGASWVVTLTFRSSRDAQRWIDRMGYDATAKAGKKTTVIRMEE